MYSPCKELTALIYEFQHKAAFPVLPALNLKTSCRTFNSFSHGLVLIPGKIKTRLLDKYSRIIQTTQKCNKIFMGMISKILNSEKKETVFLTFSKVP